jgi:hypothetical protein
MLPSPSEVSAQERQAERSPTPSSPAQAKATKTSPTWKTCLFNDEAVLGKDWRIKGGKWQFEKGGVRLCNTDTVAKLQSAQPFSGDGEIHIACYPMTGAWVRAFGVLFPIYKSGGRVVIVVKRRGDAVFCSVDSEDRRRKRSRKPSSMSLLLYGSMRRKASMANCWSSPSECLR